MAHDVSDGRCVYGDVYPRELRRAWGAEASARLRSAVWVPCLGLSADGAASVPAGK